MADVRRIVERIRANGANVVIDDGRLRIVNGYKLPANALEFVKQHGRELASFLDRESEFEERAAIIEYDGGLNRSVAEYLTRLLMSSPPAGTEAADWSWFVGQAAQIIDRAPLRRAA